MENYSTNKENIGVSSLKRNYDVANLISHAYDDDAYSARSSLKSQRFVVTEDCNQVRSKIRKFLENSGMKVKDFIEAIDVSGPSYHKFMKQYGKEKGMMSETYVNAFHYFKHREELGIPMPKKQKVSKPLSETSTNAKVGKGKKDPSIPTPIPFPSIQLEGEEEDEVEVYDSCDEIRRKIEAHLRKPNVTQASFLRDLHAQFHGPQKPKSLQATQLNKFRNYGGPLTGNMSGIYYAAYVYFEKERIANGRPKSQHRLDMENAWELKGGVDLTQNFNNIAYVCSEGRTIYMNSLGQVRSVPI
ncbi:uncharacterized protein PV09_06411 [Verruconis gallopava]|uniref:DUF7726 domain-containing protein n=1 Tax=Verruconis gallopava TaxID=253628 RepID=A0A0D1XIW4_9PEZI|nr:uncharacterized protein PV09_06411 [Verruconis gallopava]KIW02261.1 hypothetical protein PV09_06411 [Verruconis gallopava]